MAGWLVGWFGWRAVTKYVRFASKLALMVVVVYVSTTEAAAEQEQFRPEEEEDDDDELQESDLAVTVVVRVVARHCT